MAASISTFFFLLSLTFFLVLTAATRPLTSASTSPLLTKACSLATDKTLCEKVLRSEPMFPEKNLNDLTFIALDVASTSAAANIEFISQSLAGPSDSAMLKTFAECDKLYEGAVLGIDNSISSLTSAPKQVEGLLKNAISAVETCQKSAKEQAGRGAELSHMNQSLLDLLNNALSVYHVYVQN